MAKRFELIAFDADDTLWHNERSYRQARQRFRTLLERCGVQIDDEQLEARVTQTELANIEYFGYGVSSFALSLIETAINLTDARVAARDLRDLIDMAREMLTEEIELFAGARETLAALAPEYRLILITKGDLLHQTSKVERSGLKEYFTHVEVVSQKHASVYAGILARHGVDPGRFLMVGNSLRSDVLPAIDAGGWAVHVPAALSWSHEHADLPDRVRCRLFEIGSLHELPTLLEAVRSCGADLLNVK